MTQPENVPHKKMRVLIADDIQETRRNTRLMLATIDDVEVVAIASNGMQALQLTKEHHPDIVFLDINMPEMDGLTAYSEMLKIYPDIGCVVISAEKDSKPRWQGYSNVWNRRVKDLRRIHSFENKGRPISCNWLRNTQSRTAQTTKPSRSLNNWQRIHNAKCAGFKTWQ